MYILNSFSRKRSTRTIIYENFLYFIKWGLRIIQTGGRVRVVLFYPQYPGRKSVIYKVLRELKCNITNNPTKKHHLVVYWDNTTYRNANQTISKLAQERIVVNLKCTDISKSRVDKVFSEVFGYSSVVDPKLFKGKMVKKSEINASHDGIIVEGPIEPEEGFIYQKLIDNTYDEKVVVDMRIPVIKGILPFAYLKFKPITTRFAHYRMDMMQNKKPELRPIKELLSNDEVERIVVFCNRIGLDYGEIDVLRDKGDKRIYIIDVNNTPNGPSVEKSMKRESIRKLAEIFNDRFLA